MSGQLAFLTGGISPVSLCGMRMNLMTVKRKKKSKKKKKKKSSFLLIKHFVLLFFFSDVIDFLITFMLCFCIAIGVMSDCLVTYDKCT